MKKTNAIKISTGMVAGLIILSTPLPAAGGVMKLLKGEPSKACECAGYQKVAFVGPAEVKEVSGQVEFLSGVEKWTILAAKQRLKPGDILRTGTNSRAILKMTESGSLVKVTPQTILRLVPMEQGWSQVTITGEEAGSGFVIRALRGAGEYQTEEGWRRITHESDIAPGTKVRLLAGGQIDFYSKKMGLVRLEGKGEAILPKEDLRGSRELKGGSPALAARAK